MATIGGIDVGLMGAPEPRTRVHQARGRTVDGTAYSHRLMQVAITELVLPVRSVDAATRDSLNNHLANTAQGYRNTWTFVDDLSVSRTCRYLGDVIAWRRVGPLYWSADIRVEVEP